MTKSSKSTAMIRRRKNKPASEIFCRKRKNQQVRTAELNDSQAVDDVFFRKQVFGSSVIAKVMSSEKTIFLGLVVIRLVNALLIQTFFVPDEFWQSMEVAHKMAFDYGYLTWEWRVGIRSYAYPLILATFYKSLSVLGLDYRGLLIRGPRLLQGLVASVGDLYLYRLSARLAGREVAQWTLLCQLLSWFTAYCCTRTLTNSVETTLVTCALFYFPWPGHAQRRGDSQRFVALAAVSVVVRPTAAILWILMAAWHLQRCKGSALWSALRVYLTTGLTVLAVSTVIDRVWYGSWVLVHLNFLHFNVVSGGSGFYGRHPWHWYLSQGSPVVLGPHLLPFLLGVRHAWHARHNIVPLMLILWHVFVFSLLAHKEFRFLLPVLPLTMHYCGLYFHSASQPSPSPSSPPTQGRKAGEQALTEQGGGEGGGERGGKSKEDATAEEARSVGRGDSADDGDKETGSVCNCENSPPGSKDREVNVTNKEAKKKDSAAKGTDREAKGTDREVTVDKTESGQGGQRITPHNPPSPSPPVEASSSSSLPHSPPPPPPPPFNKEEERGEGKGDGGTARQCQSSQEGEGEGGGGGGGGNGTTTAAAMLSDKGEHHRGAGGRRAALKVRCLMLLLALTNLPPLLYFSLIHQRGTMDVMNFLHQAVWKQGGEREEGREGGGGVEVLFLMPCHSTPYYSHLHANVSLDFLTCEPNLQHHHHHHHGNYMDEADRFYQDPARWLGARYGQGSSSLPLPSHVVYFNSLKPNISDFLMQNRYAPCAHFFHTHFPEGRVGSHVVVSCRQGR